jgi:two-component system, OmpR family, catabolic regulation response regulator CreB
VGEIEDIMGMSRLVKKILVIEDEPAIADTIIYALKTEGFETLWSTTAMMGFDMFKVENPELIILDIGLPDLNGYELCKEIRKSSLVPVIFLTARANEIDRVVGLEIGGDDYVVKPFSPRELTARVKAVLRRISAVNLLTNQSIQGVLPQSSQMFVVDEIKMIICYFGKPLELSRNELNLLLMLIKHPGRVYSRDELMKLVWDEPGFALDRTVDAHIKNIRNKLRLIRPDIEPIETRRGFGYCMKEFS